MVSMPNVQQINSLCHITNMHICMQYIHAWQVMPFNWERLRTHPVICFYPFRVWCFLCVFFIFNHLHIFISRQRETLHFFTSKFEHTSCDIIMIINGRLSPEYHKYKHKHFTWLSHTNRSTFYQNERCCSAAEGALFSLLRTQSISRSMNYWRHIH